MSAAPSLLESLLGEQSGIVPSAPVSVKAIAWARVSTDMQEERGLSLPEQLREIRAHAEMHGIEIVAEYHDTVSAFQNEAKRVEFHRMVAAARSNPEVNAILVHDYSRFYRDSIRAMTLIRELRQQGIRVISLNDPEADTNTVAGVYMEAITFAKNEAYSREIAFHTRKGCRANVRTRDGETGWCYKNGGHPIWGYKSVQLVRGEKRKGRPVIKSIWALDDTVVEGRPVREWARHCLVEMAASGASYAVLRDFCNEHGIPSPRGGYWGLSTWHSLLEPQALLTYAGYGVWNVRDERGLKRPMSEWEIVPRAQPALISEEEAMAIRAAQARNRPRRFDRHGQSRKSQYLLSGGIFRCGRCGANMTGHTSHQTPYYVCGSLPYRRGMGCGPGVYISKQQIEEYAMAGVLELAADCADAEGFAREVDAELRHTWEERTGFNPRASQELAEIERKIGNIRQSIEDGLNDVAWANGRLNQLLIRKEELERPIVVAGEPPRIDAQQAMVLRRQVGPILSAGRAEEQKQLLRLWVDSMTLDPEGQRVEIRYRMPALVVQNVVPGPRIELGTPGFSVPCSTS